MTTKGGPAGGEPRGRGRRSFLLAAVACAAAFVGTHASALPPRVLAPTDLLAWFTPWRDDARAPANRLLLDPILQFQPWLEHSRRELLAGRPPLWNPWQGLGVVHLGNDQSAVLSPFSWPYYLLGPPGLFVGAGAKWVVAALGLFVLLRRAGADARAALAAALALPCAGPWAAWQLHPHTAALAWLPWVLLAVEDCVVGRRRGPPALALLTAATLFAGYAQGALLVAIAAGAWAIVAATVGVGGRTGAPGRGTATGVAPREALARAARPLAPAALGLALAAVHVLPFAEALRGSTALVERGGGAARAPYGLAATWGLLFPDLRGSPRDGGAPAAQDDALEHAPPYAGAALLAVAAGAWLIVRRARGRAPAARAPAPGRATVRRGAFAVAGLGVVLAWGLDLGLLSALPVLDAVRAQRGVFLVVFGLAALGGLGLDRALRRGLPPRVALGLVAALVVLAALALDATPGWAGGPGARPLRGRTFAVAFPAAAAAAALALLAQGAGGAPPAGWRRRLAAALVALEPLVVAHELAPGHPAGTLYPPVPALEACRGERVLAVGRRALPPNAATILELRAVQAYDALGSRAAAPAFARVAAFQGPLMGTLDLDDRGADALGVRWVVTDLVAPGELADWLERGWVLDPAGAQPWGGATASAPGAGRPLQARATTPARPADGLVLPHVEAPRAGPGAGPPRVHARVTVAPGGPGDAEEVREASAAAPAPGQAGPLVLALGGWVPPGRPARVEVWIEGGAARLACAGVARGGAPTFLWARACAPYRRAAALPGGALLENPDALPRVRLEGARGAARVTAEDPLRLAVEVTRAPGPAGAGVGPDAASEAGAAPRLLVADAWAPGWRATVDGRPAPVLLAGGLRAVPLPADAPAGARHRVVLSYLPTSVVVGAATSALALIALGVLLARATRSGRGAPGAAIVPA